MINEIRCMILVESYGTYGPVPVRLDAFVTALFGERVFKELDVVPMPREEEAIKVDLRPC